MIVSFKKRAPRDPIRREVDNLTRAHFRLADYSRVALERLSYLGRLEILLKIGFFFNVSSLVNWFSDFEDKQSEVLLFGFDLFQRFAN